MDNIEKPHRQRVAQHIAERHVPIEKDAFRWNRAPQFRHGLQLVESTDALDELLTDLLAARKQEPAKYRDRLRDLGCLIANLLDADKHIIHLSMNNNDWTASRFRTAGHFARAVVKLLLDKGFIGRKKGSEAAKRYTRIWATDELLEMFTGANTEYTPPQFVVLKDHDGDLVEYKHTPHEIRRVHRILEKNHEICRQVEVKGIIRDKFQRLNTSLHAVFLRNWKTYGRMHTATWRGYQGLKRDDRPGITIAGEPTVERDFSGLHPRLLYAWTGVQYDDDPYTSVNAHPELRGFLKVLLLALVNSESLTSAIYAGNFEIWDRRQHEDYKLYRLLRQLGLRTKDLIQGFMEAHPKIAPCFGRKGLGLDLMHADSKMALDIIDRFNNRRIPILAIHDSFIVPSQFDDTLRETMDEVYQRHTDGFKCPIK
jgi:hypothetical protein